MNGICWGYKRKLCWKYWPTLSSAKLKRNASSSASGLVTFKPRSSFFGPGQFIFSLGPWHSRKQTAADRVEWNIGINIYVSSYFHICRAYLVCFPCLAFVGTLRCVPPAEIEVNIQAIGALKGEANLAWCTVGNRKGEFRKQKHARRQDKGCFNY